MSGVKLKIDDGGRGLAGYRGAAGDCVVRAISIATRKDYQVVYDELYRLAGKSPRNGFPKKLIRLYMKNIGWEWVPTMNIGSGCRVHLRPDELPMGRIVVNLSRHVCALVDGVIHDTHDPSRGGTRCVYGYYYPNLGGSGE